MTDHEQLSQQYSPRERRFAIRLLEDGLCLPTCDACGAQEFPAPSRCPNCASDVWSYPSVEGHGRVVGHTVIRRPSHSAFQSDVRSVLVALDDGQTVLGSLTGEPERVSCGDRVQFSEAVVVEGYLRLSFRHVE